MVTIERLPADVDEATFTELGGFLIAQSSELLDGIPVDINAASLNGFDTIAKGMTLVARDDAGEIVGTLALVEVPLHWATDPGRHCLVDFWFVVRPDQRDGHVRKPLEEAAAAIGAERELPVFVFKRRRIR